MSKIVCVYHSIDLDGWMSAAIVKHWVETDKTEIQPNVFLYRKDVESLTFVGYNYGQPIPDLSKYDKVIMCDISFPANVMLDMWKKLIWIDHHISAIKAVEEYCDEYDYDKSKPIGLRDTEFAACELTWKYFFPNEPMPEIVRLLGRYDCFGHKQVWKPVVEYEGLYEVSNHGNVRSLDRIIIENNTNKERLIKGINLSIANSKRGYRVVVLCNNGIEKMRNVHQLVAESFIPNTENKPCINHKDFNRLNNHIENLEWCTYAENNLHSIDEGKKGKTVIQLTKDGEFVEQFDSIKRAELHTGIASQNIGKVCKGEREFAGKYKWEYGVDKDTFLQFVPEDEETKVLEFQYGARQCITDYIDAYEHLLDCNIETILNRGHAIYQYLCTEAKQVYKNGFEVWFDDEVQTSAGNSYKFICINKERFNPINFGMDYHKDGYDGAACFHFDGKQWSFSLYNDNGKVDCSTIAKQYGGGGHFSAAGMILNNEQFLQLITNNCANYR